MAENVVVGIPTAGRAEVLRETLAELQLQTRPADKIIVCGSKPADLTGVEAAGVVTLLAPAGLPRQRNAIIEQASDATVLVFFDDDFLPCPGYLAAVEQHFVSHPHTVMVTGTVLMDGINGPGLTPSKGRDILATHPLKLTGSEPVFNGYGCNMGARMAPIRDHKLRFDERLPLYGWQEDVDLSRRLARFGNVLRLRDAQGVHLGVKSGRGSGLRLGYSQVANPLYLSAKGEGYPLTHALKHLGRNMAMNAARAAWAEAYVDRRGRLRGNLLALSDLLRGRMAPERILEL